MLYVCFCEHLECLIFFVHVCLLVNTYSVYLNDKVTHDIIVYALILAFIICLR